MTALRSLLTLVIAATAALALPAVAQGPASSPPAADGQRNSWLPSKGRSYLGLNLGRSHFNVPCGSSISLLCDDKDRSVQVYGGTTVGNFWGVELGYLDMGRIARAGGKTKAQGLNLSLVGKAPFGRFGVFGKVGTTYGRTETTTVAGSGVAAGTERGFGLSYGAGVSYDITPRLSATLQWDSNDFRFAGSGRDAVRSTSLGLQYRY